MFKAISQLRTGRMVRDVCLRRAKQTTPNASIKTDVVYIYFCHLCALV